MISSIICYVNVAKVFRRTSYSKETGIIGLLQNPYDFLSDSFREQKFLERTFLGAKVPENESSRE